MICIQLKIKCKTILLKTLENGLNKSYFMTYQVYFAPEYLKYGKATDKTDVFSYRVVILKWLVEEGQLRENQIFSKW